MGNRGEKTNKVHHEGGAAEIGVEVDVWDKIVIDILKMFFDLMNSIDLRMTSIDANTRIIFLI